MGILNKLKKIVMKMGDAQDEPVKEQPEEYITFPEDRNPYRIEDPERRRMAPSGMMDETKCKGPRYCIGFPNRNHPTVPYYCVANQPEVWKIAPRANWLYYDPIEDAVEFKRIIGAVNQQVDAEMDGVRGLGSCYRAWSIRAQILREQYGIEWNCPSTMNPDCMFD